jgi:hypothetical protein
VHVVSDPRGSMAHCVCELGRDHAGIVQG